MKDQNIRSREAATEPRSPEASESLTLEELETVSGGCTAPDDQPVVVRAEDPNVVYVN